MGDPQSRSVNTGPATTTDRRAGLLVQLTDLGTARHFVVDGIDVHDVNGADFKDPDPSGGILFSVKGPFTLTRFDGIRVQDSTVSHVDRTGIGTSSTWGRRAEHPNGPVTWAIATIICVKIVVQVKLIPDAVQAPVLGATLHAVNDAANWVSGVAFDRGVPREYELRKYTYAELKTRGLGAQAAQHTIKKVRDAYTTLKANLRAGNLGRQDSTRRRKAVAKPIAFRPEAAHPFDDRCLSWQYDAQTVSIWTTAGRLKNVRFACSTDALKTLREHRKGESDLIERDGVFYLIAVCEVPEAKQYEPDGFLGVDLGIVNIATTSTGYKAAGRGLNRHRKRQLDLRRKLQAKGTQSAKRRLKHRRRKEARRAANVNHIISKQIVTEAERTSHGIALEDLGGIRQRVRLRKPQRVTLHSWAFHQLGQYVQYKARRAGVPLVYVDPAYTSQTCADCGHIEKKNRVTQALFICRWCGVVAHADRNASRNIAARGEAVWIAGRESRVPAPS